MKTINAATTVKIKLIIATVQNVLTVVFLPNTSAIISIAANTNQDKHVPAVVTGIIAFPNFPAMLRTYF